MPYYGRGDYRSGYYRGDPINILGGLVGGVTGFIRGGPAGAVAGAAQGLLGTGAPKTPKTNLPMIAPPQVNVPISTFGTGGIDVPRTTPGAVKTPGLGGTISRVLPGGMSGYQVSSLSGLHMIKKGPHAGEWTRNRRMNVTNPRALRRATRRLSGFGKMVQRVKRAVGRANTAVGNKSRRAARAAA